LINAAPSLESVSLDSDDAQRGVTVLQRALEVPMRKIAANAGSDGSVIINNVRREQVEKKSNAIGFNVLSEDYVDMVKAGIIDPAKVTRGALENAASIAAMILTTEALVTEKPEPPAPMPSPDMGGGMGGGMGGMM
ncbi:MAG: TCP-1/cpn60 chaperonin family protein, partial [Verrucomicrobiota bacterium]|nr:TCP-1/cpn60 chaperonin family protein [Verrucomicrobiota bacterium]